MKKEEKKPPLKVGDELKLGVTRMGHNGDPIFIHKGFIIFLKDKSKGGVQLNAMLKIKITKVMSKFAFAERV